MPTTTFKFFQSGHLPKHLQDVSADCALLAAKMETNLMDCPEKSAGMRKLLEAKDCFVRAALETKEREDKEREEMRTEWLNSVEFENSDQERE